MRALCLLLVLAACPASTPTPTGTVCPTPDPGTLTYDNFGRDFMTRYCTMCHASTLTHSMRNGAPIYHDFDTLLGVLEVPDHIDEQAGWGPKAQNNFMPGGGTGGKCPTTPGGPLDRDCPQPTGEERTNLAMWLACERDRPHDFADAGVDAP